ncbi:hypothetical protein HPB49_025157 [Dermacentor silvarum]|uniref:Uncharacterized protein n=1 Tax=Dermacentor silvarum TaxID=543639 RepID=A0ACB8DHD4_DERSI|nr:hypothetical protein HPB49_025157 [Dermacentor silvarum]
MPIDMPKEDAKVVMRPRGGLNVARTEASIIMSVVRTAARLTKEEAKADTICTNAQQNIIVVNTPDERRATLYSKVKALNIGMCFGCGIDNPREGHERECKPKCKLCGGQHPMGERECKNKYNMPYVVKKRQWERKMEAMQQQPDPESSPPRRASPAERPRGESKQRDSSRKRDDSKIGRSASRRRPSQSRERGSWADAVKANMAEKRQPPAQNAAKKIQEANGRKQEMTEDEPEVEVDPRATIAAGPAPKRRAIEGAKERKITERIEKQGHRFDHLLVTSKVTNERLTALEQRVQQMTTNIQRTIQNMIAQMQTQLQAHTNAKGRVKRNLDAKYLPTTPTERHPDYQGNENETLDRDTETWEVRPALQNFNGRSAAGLDRLEAATRIYDQETQLKAVQQVSAALGRQRPSETEDKGGGTPRKGKAALSDPRK